MKSKLNKSKNCKNCNCKLEQNFCPNCGQKKFNSNASLYEVFNEWIDEHFGMSGKLWKTITVLMSKPGELSRLFMEGHVVSYIRPVRLILVTSVIFILLAKSFGLSIVQSNMIFNNGEEKSFNLNPELGLFYLEDCKASSLNNSKLYQDYLKTQNITKKDKSDDDDKKKLEFILDNFCELSEYTYETLTYFLWIVIPLLSLVLWFFHRKTYPSLLPHFIFSFHQHSFIFVLCILSSLAFVVFGIYTSQAFIFCLLWICIYFFLASKKFYKDTWKISFVKSFSSLVLYLIVIFLLLVLLFKIKIIDMSFN